MLSVTANLHQIKHLLISYINHCHLFGEGECSPSPLFILHKQ
jgi:hypothetical protein